MLEDSSVLPSSELAGSTVLWVIGGGGLAWEPVPLLITLLLSGRFAHTTHVFVS
ncbi:hypothetical protein M413DRAFT_447466 [Hebeloma cylindrosporum]|uniref:Uncharacterized protein n=1 Tax=Hebeloma cylindrosporum TaxID=76867 RepID=A0A0C2XNA4_HEBCY|nr:hypothetical protein M413DRAFT_447466 [Hebeloma cylindrosporum h7]